MRAFTRLAAAGAVALSLLSAPLSASAAAQTWTVTTGGTPDQAIQALVFGPSQITIDQGDTVTWHLGSGEPHTVSFGFSKPLGPTDPQATQPIGSGSTFDGSTQISSGLVFQGKDYSLTFTAAPGTYTYYCFIHPGMVGQVVVQAPGTAYPQTQDQVSAAGQQQIQAAINATQTLVAGAKVTQATNANGSTTWTVPASVGSGNAYDARFIGGNLTIKAGDTVTWVDSDPVVPHTVTFGPVPPGPPDAVGFKPVGGPVYSGGFSNGIVAPFPPFSKSYSLTFNTAGSFKYVCLLHVGLGMVGNITVVGGAPVQAPIQAPVIPSAPPSTGGGGPGTPAWGIGGAIALLAVGGYLLGRRAVNRNI